MSLFQAALAIAVSTASCSKQWAYIRDWHSEPERHTAYDGFLHFYNHHRSHGALGWATPIDTLHRLPGDNVPAEHN